MRYAILPIIGMWYRFRDISAGREGIDGAEGSGEGEGGEGVVVPGVWIGFRNYFWGNEVTEEITLGLVNCFMCALPGVSMDEEDAFGRRLQGACNATVKGKPTAGFEASIPSSS